LYGSSPDDFLEIEVQKIPKIRCFLAYIVGVYIEKMP